MTHIRESWFGGILVFDIFVEIDIYEINYLKMLCILKKLEIRIKSYAGALKLLDLSH